MRFKLLLLIPLLANCSGITLNNNIEPYAKNRLESSARAAGVKSYSAAQMTQLNATSLGLVEAEYCQSEPLGARPSQSYLISQLKLKTQQLGGNGLVFDQCTAYNNSLCHAHLRCQGLAVRVPG